MREDGLRPNFAPGNNAEWRGDFIMGNPQKNMEQNRAKRLTGHQ
jgi:hypothetical protein